MPAGELADARAGPRKRAARILFDRSPPVTGPVRKWKRRPSVWAILRRQKLVRFADGVSSRRREGHLRPEEQRWATQGAGRAIRERSHRGRGNVARSDRALGEERTGVAQAAAGRGRG